MPGFESATVVELAARRKTARRFERTPINFEDIQYCIKAAVQDPSGANKQPWRFVVVDNEEAKAKVRASCEAQEKRFHEKVEENLRRWFKSKGIT